MGTPLSCRRSGRAVDVMERRVPAIGQKTLSAGLLLCSWRILLNCFQSELACRRCRIPPSFPVRNLTVEQRRSISHIAAFYDFSKEICIVRVWPCACNLAGTVWTKYHLAFAFCNRAWKRWTLLPNNAWSLQPAGSNNAEFYSLFSAADMEMPMVGQLGCIN